MFVFFCGFAAAVCPCSRKFEASLFRCRFFCDVFVVFLTVTLMCVVKQLLAQVTLVIRERTGDRRLTGGGGVLSL